MALFRQAFLSNILKKDNLCRLRKENITLSSFMSTVHIQVLWPLKSKTISLLK